MPLDTGDHIFMATRTAGCLVIAAIVAVFAATSAAEAHARLRSAHPPKDSTLSARVSEIRLVFNERVEPSLSVVEIHTAAGKLLATSKGTAICVDKTCVLAMDPPGPGSYSVTYRVLSEDGHVVEGSYEFHLSD